MAPRIKPPLSAEKTKKPIAQNDDDQFAWMVQEAIAIVRSLLTFALSLLLWVASAQAQVDIYIFAGQSNMAGEAPIQGEPAIANPHSLWMMCGLGSGWEPAHDPTNPYPGSGASPALWAGDKLATLSGNQVGIINVATPGTWMWEWAPDYSVDSRYGLITKAYKQACQAGAVRGFFWYQGEADADTAGDVHDYGPRMYAFLNAVHHDLNGVPIVFVQLGPNPNWSGRPYWRAIQLVQQWISEGAPSWLQMVTAKDLSAAGMPSPQEHLNQASVITLVAEWATRCTAYGVEPVDRSRKIRNR